MRNIKDLIAVVVVALTLLGVALLVGLTTHQTALERNKSDERVKIACASSGKWSSADCSLLVRTSQEDSD
jgi:hypothetical protein